jgi:hypothetical protein
MKYLHHELDFFKHQAKRLKKHLKPDSQITTMKSLDIIAFAHGFECWNELYLTYEKMKTTDINQMIDVAYVNELPWFQRDICFTVVKKRLIEVLEQYPNRDDEALFKAISSLYLPESSALYQQPSYGTNEALHWDDLYGSLYLVGDKKAHGTLLNGYVVDHVTRNSGLLVVNKSQAAGLPHSLRTSDDVTVIDLTACQSTTKPLGLCFGKSASMSEVEAFYEWVQANMVGPGDKKASSMWEGRSAILVQAIFKAWYSLPTPVRPLPDAFDFSLASIESLLALPELSMANKSGLVSVLQSFQFTLDGMSRIIKRPAVAMEQLHCALRTTKEVSKLITSATSKNNTPLCSLFDDRSKPVVIICSDQGFEDHLGTTLERATLAGILGILTCRLYQDKVTLRQGVRLGRKPYTVYFPPDSHIIPNGWSTLPAQLFDVMKTITTSYKLKDPQRTVADLLEYNILRENATHLVGIDEGINVFESQFSTIQRPPK